MNTGGDPGFRWALAILAGLLLLGAALRWPSDLERYFWGDEAWRVYFIRNANSIADVAEVSARTKSWLQLSEFLLGRCSELIFSGTTWGLLLWPFLAGLFSIWAAYAVLCRFCRPETALLGAALVALGPGFILHSRELKPFSLDLAMTLCLLSVAAGTSGRVRSGVGGFSRLVATGCVFAVSSLVFMFVYPAAVAYCLMGARRRSGGLLLYCSLPLLIFVLYYAFFLGPQDTSRSTGHAAFVSLYLHDLQNLPNIAREARRSLPQFVPLGWLAALLLYLVITPVVSLWRRDRFLVLAMVPFVAQCGLSAAGRFPMFSRASMYLYGIMVISVAYVLEQLILVVAGGGRGGRLGRVAAAILLVVAGASFFSSWSRLGRGFGVAIRAPGDAGKKAFSMLAEAYRSGDKVRFGFGFEYIFHVHKQDALAGLPGMREIDERVFSRRYRLADRTPEQLCRSFRARAMGLRPGDRVWLVSRNVKSYREAMPSVGHLEVLLEEVRQGLMLLELEASPESMTC